MKRAANREPLSQALIVASHCQIDDDDCVKKPEQALQLPVTWKTLLLLLTAFWAAVAFWYIFH